MIPRNFPEQASRFATTREEHARVRSNIDREIQQIRTEAAGLAVELIIAGDTSIAVEVMEACLEQQLDLAKIRRLEVIA